MLRIAVVDGMGGGLGSQIVSQLRHEFGDKEIVITALGTNSTATTAMMKAGAHRGATGENAIRVNLKEMDCVIGPLGIIIPDALMGEITASIARIIALAACKKILLPLNQPHVEIIGLENRPLGNVIRDTLARVKELLTAAKQQGSNQ